MSGLTIHSKVIGKIQINTLSYNKDVFKIIVKRLTHSNIFHSVCTQSINHCPPNSKRRICNCDEILKYITKEFYTEAERFSQVFVPVIIANFHSKNHQYMICELLFLHDKLLKSRKDFFVDDVKEKALFTSSKYKEDCVCKLHEILTVNKTIIKRNCNSMQNNSTTQVNNTCFREVMKELVLNKLLPLSAKTLPLDSFRLQKVFDICNKYYLPDDMTISILNNLQAVKMESNQSNYNVQIFNNPESEYDNFSKYNTNKSSFDKQNVENSWDFVTNSTSKKNINGGCYLGIVRNKETNSSNKNHDKRSLYKERHLCSCENMENSHNRTISSMRNAKSGPDTFNSFSNNADSGRWRTINNRSYRPTTLRTSLEPQFSDSFRDIQSNRKSNFHWLKDNGSSQARGSLLNDKFQRRLSPYKRYSQNDGSAYLNYNDVVEPNYNKCYHDGEEHDENTYEVVIDDDCYDLDNVETITVRDGDGNVKKYIDSQRIAPVNCRQNESIRQPIFHGNSRQFMPKKATKKVSFINIDNNKDNLNGCDSSTLAKVVLCQEANSMDALMSVLNRQIDQNDLHQCLKLSVRAEHVIKRPDFPDDVVNNNPNDCLKISSEVQAQWENLNCDDETKVPALPIDLVYNADGNYFNGNFRSIGTSPNLSLKNSNVSQNIYKKGISPNKTSLQNISDICDKAMQTEKFFFLETSNERMILSPNSFEQIKPFPFSKVSVGMNTEIDAHKKSMTNSLHFNNPRNNDETSSQFYFFEDRNRRIICSPNDFCFNDKETQTNQVQTRSHFMSNHIQPQEYNLPTFINREYRPNVNFNDSYLVPSVGGYYRDIKQEFSDLHPKFNLQMTEDPRFTQSNISGTAAYVENLRNSNKESEVNEMLKNSSKMYSLQPYINSVGANSFATFKNEDQHSLQKQMNYSSSINYADHKNSSSPEDFIYIDSIKLSPILDVHTGSQNIQQMNLYKRDSGCVLHPRFRNSDIDNKHKYSHLSLSNSSQNNNSNLIYDENYEMKFRKYIFKSKNQLINKQDHKCEDSNSSNIGHILEKHGTFRTSKGYPKKYDKYYINSSCRDFSKSCYYLKQYNKENKILKHKNRLDCRHENSMIPIIPSKNNPTKVDCNTLKVDSLLEYHNPYNKSIQYIQEKFSTKRKEKNPSESVDCNLTEDKISDMKSLNNFLKKLNHKFDYFNNNEINRKNEFFQYDTIHKLKVRKPRNRYADEISKTSIGHVIDKMIVVMLPKDQNILQKPIKEQPKNNVIFNNKSSNNTLNLQENENNLCLINKLRNNENKYTEVEVYFNRI